MTSLLASILGVSFAAGLNAYATVLALGVMQRFGWIHLPAGLDVLGSNLVLLGASALYIIEFIADKVPWVDSIWDGIHTVIRPAAGALLAYGIVGNVDPGWQVMAALIGGGIAFTSHAAKASTRAAVNVSPEPFSNWALSLIEDALSFALVWLTGSHPIAAIVIAVTLLALAVFVIWKLSRFARRVFRRSAA
jgi:nicotinamide riboside transporter PnuC